MPGHWKTLSSQLHNNAPHTHPTVRSVATQARSTPFPASTLAMLLAVSSTPLRTSLILLAWPASFLKLSKLTLLAFWTRFSRVLSLLRPWVLLIHNCYLPWRRSEAVQIFQRARVFSLMVMDTQERRCNLVVHGLQNIRFRKRY